MSENDIIRNLLLRDAAQQHEINELLTQENLKVNEHAFAHTVGMLQALPALRVLWPMSSLNYTNPQGLDIAGGGYHLTNNNGSDFGYDELAPYAQFDGINQYLSRADGGAANWADITGTENYIISAQNGLTLGGWFYLTRITNAEFLMAKYTGVAAASSYALAFRGNVANDPIDFLISDGAALDNIALNFNAVAGAWYFFVGRYTPPPAAEIKVWAGQSSGLTSDTNIAGIPAALNDSATLLSVGALSTGASLFLDGRASMCWLCAAALSDDTISALFSQSRKMFGV